MAFLDMRTCPHIGPKTHMSEAWYKKLHRPVFLFQNTLEPPPSDVIISSVTTDYRTIEISAAWKRFTTKLVHRVRGENKG